MRVSSKKKRGQQRKAAKDAAAKQKVNKADDEDEDWINNMAVTNPQLFEEFVTLTVSRVEIGHDNATLSLYDPKSVGVNELPSLVYDNALPYVLNFLKRCEDRSFHKVLSSVGGDLITPSRWIKVLVFYVESLEDQSSWLQIAENIGPLVRCMCKDTERLFFKSSKHWREGINVFVQLVLHLICKINKKENDQIIEAILQHNGLLESIIQWGFWDSGRPDIVKELGANACAHVVTCGRNTIRILVTDAASNSISPKDKNLLDLIGTTPILSKAYDPNCMVSYAEGLIQQMKINGWCYDSFSTIRHLVEADCVDKRVIIELIDLGLDYTNDYIQALRLAAVTYPMILQGSDMTRYQISDTRVAFAIRLGLIEMYLSFIECFGGHIEFSVGKGSMFDVLDTALKTVYAVSLHQKSAKAIRHQRVSIEEMLVGLNENVNINPKCKELLDMVGSILSVNGSYCCRCSKSLSKTEVKQCNGCIHMAYCSKSCQREDWRNGHSITCSKSFLDVETGRFQGRIWPEAVPDDQRAAAKLEELEKNLTMIQLKLFLDNSDTILSQASSLDLPLCDCVVTFDLSKCPPSISTSRYTKHCAIVGTPRKDFEGSRSEENITCVYISLFFTGELDEDSDTPLLELQRLFPHEWLSNRNNRTG